jgi:hypothetical protein
MGARSIGELIAPIIARTQHMMAFQAMLVRCPTPEDRKGFIMSAHSYGALDDEECGLLLTANQLESA